MFKVTIDVIKYPHDIHSTITVLVLAIPRPYQFNELATTFFTAAHKKCTGLSKQFIHWKMCSLPIEWLLNFPKYVGVTQVYQELSDGLFGIQLVWKENPSGLSSYSEYE